MKARQLTNPPKQQQFVDVTPDLNGQAAFTEFLALEACVSTCEVLAGDLSEAGRTAALAQVGECIAACDVYVSALARESRYAGRLATLCAEVCEETARLCERQGGEAARECRKWCRACQRLLKRRRVGVLVN